MMKRREFITLIGGAAAAWPLAAHAQQMRRIGVLMSVPESDPESKLRKTTFEEELQKLGWSINHNVNIDYRAELIRVFLGIAIACSLIAPAHAQERRSIAALLADGYEIKSVLFVPLESAKQLNEQNNSSSVVLSLQKGQSIGVCFITLSAYLSLPKQVLEEASCAVR